MPGNPRLGPIIVDANILFSALLRDGTTRLLILHPKFDLHTPEYLWEELERNRDFLVRKSGTTQETFQILAESLRQRIRSIPLEVIRPHVDEAARRLSNPDDPDIAYVAAAIAIDGTIWTHDRRLSARAQVPRIDTAALFTRLYE